MEWDMSHLERQFIEILHYNEWSNQAILLAVSGGADSMALLQLMIEAQKHITTLRIGVAHINYNFRGNDSIEDALLVRTFTEKHKIEYFEHSIDGPQLLKDNRGNLQNVARKIRYEYFNKICTSHNFDLIATAHHKEDSVETILINLFKGTGIAGLHGILPHQQNIIRPLLEFTKDLLIRYNNAHHTPWREDVSNQKDHYLRNKIRLNILPALEQELPNIIDNIYQTSLRLQRVEHIYNKSIEQIIPKLIIHQQQEIHIPINKLLQYFEPEQVLYEIVKRYDFSSNQMKDIMLLLDAHTGKYVQNASFKIIKNRSFLIITPICDVDNSLITIDKTQTEIEFGAQLSLQMHLLIEQPNFENANSTDLYIDTKNLQFPLLLRPWKEGDYFYPLGMGMKKKKISKFLIDQKTPIHEKANKWVLMSGDKIIWLVGERPDERFKLKLSTSEILHIKFNK